jgi:hypothetical protein
MEPKKKHLLHRLAKKVLIHSRQTIGHRCMVPNTRRFADCSIWLPKCNGLRTGPGAVEPEVYFRIVHLAQIGPNKSLLAHYREQTVQVALGPKGAFEGSTTGSLGLRAPPSQVVKAALPSKPAKEPKTPRIVELLRKAIEWRRQIDAGEVQNKAEIARREGITRARVTQVMELLRLAPEIQEKILTMPPTVHRRLVSERMLRPIGAITDHLEQLREFQEHMI